MGHKKKKPAKATKRKKKNSSSEGISEEDTENEPLAAHVAAKKKERANSGPTAALLSRFRALEEENMSLRAQLEASKGKAKDDAALKTAALQAELKQARAAIKANELAVAKNTAVQVKKKNPNIPQVDMAVTTPKKGKPSSVALEYM